MDTKALFKIGYGLYVLTSKDEKDNGCIINSVMQVAANPDKIAFSVSKKNYTHDIIVKTKKANISVLSEKTDFETFKHFGFQSGRDVEKFVDYKNTKRSENGILYLTNSTNSYLSLEIEDIINLGSHSLFIAKLIDCEILSKDLTVSYDFYQKNIKPSAKAEAKTGWICTICNFIYEGENLPADYICPICKHPSNDFKKL